MISRHIRSLGLELEGGILSYKLSEFEEKMYSQFEDFDIYYSVGSDGSVNVPCPSSYSYRECYRWYSSVEVRFWHDDINVLIYFVKELWNHGFKQNSTCGNHMHIRFDNIFYASIFSLLDAQLMFINEYKNQFFGNPKYMYRLSNQYSQACTTQLCINDNMLNKYGSRYRAINFRSITDKGYSTLEIRIMPYANDANELISMMMFNINTIEKIINHFTINDKIIVKAFDLKDIKRSLNKIKRSNGKKKKLMIREVY
jgi:hypothetical protein